MKVSDIMEPNVATVAEADSVGLALHLMLWHGIRHLPVVRDGQVAGVISQSDLLASASEIQDPESTELTVGEVMSSPALTTSPYAPLADAAAMMAVHKLGCLPVEDEGKLVGILTTTDLLSKVAHYPLPNPDAASAGTVMHTSPYVVRPDGLLLDAVATMALRGVRHLVVVDGLERVVGMVSDRDIRAAVGRPTNTLEDAKLRDAVANMRVDAVMTPEPRTVPADATLHSLIDALIEDRFGALPVVDEEDRLVGIVSYIDVLHRLRPDKAS